MPPAQVQAREVNDGIIPLHFPAHQFIRLGDRDGLDYSGHIYEQGFIHRPRITQNGDGYPFSPRHGLGFVSQGFDFGHHRFDLGVGSVLVHYNEHGLSPLQVSLNKGVRSPR